MSDHENSANRNIVEREQVRRRQLAETQRKKVAERKIVTRRNIFVGEILREVLPEIDQIQLQRTSAGNEVVFAPLRKFLRLLFSDRTLVEKLKAESGWGD